MIVVTLASRKMNVWQKLRLEGVIGKWPEAQQLKSPQKNAVSVVVSAASTSVLQAERFFVRGANTEMRMTGAIAGNLETRRKKFMARQCAVLIGFYGDETRKQVLKIDRKPKRLVMQQRCAPSWSLRPRNKKLTLTYSPAGCGFSIMWQKTSGNVDSPIDRWETWQKTSGAYQ